MQVYGLFFLVAVAIGGVVWVFVYPFLSGEKKTERRMAGVARTEPYQEQNKQSADRPRRANASGEHVSDRITRHSVQDPAAPRETHLPVPSLKPYAL